MSAPEDPTPPEPRPAEGGPSGPDEPLRLEIVAEAGSEALDADLRRVLSTHSVIRTQFADADLWLVARDILEKDVPAGEHGPGGDPGAPFRAILHNLAGNEVVEVLGELGDPDSVRVLSTARPRLPNEEEHTWARDVLRMDPDLAQRVDAGEVSFYRPMPPVANVQTADGSIDRAVTVGVREVDGSGAVRHRVVAVRAADGEIVEDDPRLPQGDRECGPPPGDGCPAAGGDNQARLRVWRGDALLWELVLVRPSASSGVNGSGVELRYVDYQGVRALYRAHVPILNVAYEGDAGSGRCGPTYRDWMNEESCFQAEGEEPVAGFRVCTARPRTILDGTDGGGFRGVAIWVDGDDLLVLSQLQAGWYRYVSEWRFSADGTIRPRVGFAAVANPCTCEPHVHHAYWRLDFDVTGPDLNLVQEHNSPTLPGQLSPWHTIRFEAARPRDPAHQRQWRVRSVRSPHGYTVVPGAEDGTADHYGAGDVWVVVYDGDEIDDGEGFTTDPARSRAGIDKFVSGEVVERQDVVFWYGAHFRHAPHEEGATTDGGGHRLGPDLIPFNWKPLPERGPYIPIAPPVQDDPDDEDPGPPDPSEFE